MQQHPKLHGRVTANYTVPGAWGEVTGWVTFEHVGQRYEDESALNPLGSYYMLGAGIVANVQNNWQFRVQGTNLTNKIAVTEGNARRFGPAGGIADVAPVRPYEGREANFTAYYKFSSRPPLTPLGA